MFFRGVTWQRDSHGLFDFESKNLVKKNMKTSASAKVWRVNNDIDLSERDATLVMAGADSSSSDDDGGVKQP